MRYLLLGNPDSNQIYLLHAYPNLQFGVLYQTKRKCPLKEVALLDLQRKMLQDEGRHPAAQSSLNPQIIETQKGRTSLRQRRKH